MKIDPGNPVVKTGFSGIYVHYPYCIQKCEYCDFYSLGNGKKPIPDENTLFQRYKEEIRQRISENPSVSDLEFDTIFFGGGTPSRADISRIADLIKFLKIILKFQNIPRLRWNVIRKISLPIF